QDGEREKPQALGRVLRELEDERDEAGEQQERYGYSHEDPLKAPHGAAASSGLDVTPNASKPVGANDHLLGPVERYHHAMRPVRHPRRGLGITFPGSPRPVGAP